MSHLRVVVDTREKRSGVSDHLRKMGVLVDYRMLGIADYLVGQYAIERKTARDFVASLYSGRLFDQMNRLSASYEGAFMIVEGDVQDVLMNLRNPRIFWGALISIALRFNVNIFFTLDADQTAQLIRTFALQRSSDKGGRPSMIIMKARSRTLEEQQLAVAGALPGIGPKLAHKLLSRFGTLRALLRADIGELKVRGGIGRARAEKVAALLDSTYKRQSPPKQATLSRESYASPQKLKMDL